MSPFGSFLFSQERNIGYVMSTILAQSLARLRIERIAMLRFWYSGSSRPPQFPLANAWGGILGSGQQRCEAQWWHSHAAWSGSPIPAHEGLVSGISCAELPWCSAAPTALQRSDAASGFSTGTRWVFKSHRMCGNLGCCTLEACSSSSMTWTSAAMGTKGIYFSVWSKRWIFSAWPK